MVSQDTTDLHILVLHYNSGQLYFMRDKHWSRIGLAFIANSNVDVESIQLKEFLCHFRQWWRAKRLHWLPQTQIPGEIKQVSVV
ncbi:hypothetical protein ACVWXM_008707 [Bradyrhizobium sp. GM7.3]